MALGLSISEPRPALLSMEIFTFHVNWESRCEWLCPGSPVRHLLARRLALRKPWIAGVHTEMRGPRPCGHPGQPASRPPLCLLPQENADPFLLAVDTDWKVGLSSHLPEVGGWGPKAAGPSPPQPGPRGGPRPSMCLEQQGLAAWSSGSLWDHLHCVQWLCLPPAQWGDAPSLPEQGGGREAWGSEDGDRREGCCHLNQHFPPMIARLMLQNSSCFHGSCCRDNHVLFSSMPDSL